MGMQMSLYSLMMPEVREIRVSFEDCCKLSSWWWEVGKISRNPLIDAVRLWGGQPTAGFVFADRPLAIKLVGAHVYNIQAEAKTPHI